MAATLRVATRGSALARWQAERIVELLDVDAELIVVSTRGDQRADTPIHAMGGTGVFVKEVSQQVLEGHADIAVHSAKDLPTRPEPGLVLAAIPQRDDPRDALVGCTLGDLPTGGRVGTGSVRRRAQLANLRPDLTFGELRGNIATRLEKAAAYDAVVVAATALDRLGLGDRIAERLAPSVMLPQVAQGALAVECRADDDDTRELVATIDDAPAHGAVAAERAYLDRLGGGCNLPVGALATVTADGTVELEALLASLDGRMALRGRESGRDPAAVGRAAADQILDARGGRLLLDDSALASETGAADAEVTPKAREDARA
jgi:hydroxymethylbilane synthase